MNASYETANSSFEAAVVFANIRHQSQQHSTAPASPLPHLLHSRQSKTSNPSYHRNQQYSIIGLTNAAGTLVERYTYTAYGTLGIYAANGTVRTTSTYNQRYTYTGREYDPDLNLYHFRARWYDPATGGFISRDPLGYVDGMSLYRGYFGVHGVDPRGKLSVVQDLPTDKSVADTSNNRYASITRGNGRRYYSYFQSWGWFDRGRMDQRLEQCANSGYCFCATAITGRHTGFKRTNNDDNSVTVRTDIFWTVTGTWHKKNANFLPAFHFQEYWNYDVNGRPHNPTDDRYSGRDAETWHSFPASETDWFFTGMQRLNPGYPGARDPVHTGITACSVWDQCAGALTSGTLPTTLTLADSPSMTVTGATISFSFIGYWKFSAVNDPNCCANPKNVQARLSLKYNSNQQDTSEGGSYNPANPLDTYDPSFPEDLRDPTERPYH